MTTHGSGAGPRMERDELDRQRVSTPVVGESALLHRIRRHVNLRVRAGATRRGSCFANVFAALMVTLRMQLIDILFSFLRHNNERGARERHKDIIEGVAIMLDTCSHIQDLAAWDYKFTTTSKWQRSKNCCFCFGRLGASVVEQHNQASGRRYSPGTIGR